MRPKVAKTTLACCVILACVVVPSADGGAQVIRAGPPTCKAVAVTFDMCPVREGTGYDGPLIQMLIERRIPATFFLSGRWIATHEAEVRALLAVPFFEIGTHGQVHAHLPSLDGDHQRAEIRRPVLLLQERFGHRGSLFRPPYGEYDDTTVEIARELGLRFILWNVVSGDPDPRLSQAQMLEDLRARVRNGSIIVFHANGKGRHTRSVVEDLAQEWNVKKGLQPVTVTELLHQCPDMTSHGYDERIR
jgi:peptidoglycan/xylan/chitin deacetylase (PgdA/CDA1 family)